MSQTQDNEFKFFPDKLSDWEFTDHLKWMIPALTTAGAATHGYMSTSAQGDDETDDDYRLRKIKNALSLGGLGALGSGALVAGATYLANAAGKPTVPDKFWDGLTWERGLATAGTSGISNMIAHSAIKAKNQTADAIARSFNSQHKDVLDYFGGDATKASEAIRAGKVPDALLRRMGTDKDFATRVLHVAGDYEDIHKDVLNKLTSDVKAHMKGNSTPDFKGLNLAKHLATKGRAGSMKANAILRSLGIVAGLSPLIPNVINAFSDDKK